MCADEEWPYEPWSAQEAKAAARNPYREDWQQWSRPPESTRTTQQSIGTLRSLAHRVLTTPKPWLNEPQQFPPDAFDPRVLLLDFVCVGLLELLLCDHWNDVTAVFADPRRYYWIHWWTNA